MKRQQIGARSTVDLDRAIDAFELSEVGVISIRSSPSPAVDGQVDG